MECGICLENDIIKKNIHVMECQHKICKICYQRLTKCLCPFCRRVIKPSKKKTTKPIPVQNRGSISDRYEHFIFGDDFVVPIIRQDRSSYRRKKLKSKQNKLKEALRDENSTISEYFPNCHKRMNKKLEHLSLS